MTDQSDQDRQTTADIGIAARGLLGLRAAQLAELIDAHLKRFEKDPVLNKYEAKHPASGQELRPYWNAGCWASGRHIRVMYISYQGSSVIPRADAAIYLAMLDAGYVGRHFEALRKYRKDTGLPEDRR